MKKTLVLTMALLMMAQLSMAQKNNKKNSAQQPQAAEQLATQNNNTMILLETTLGNIKIRLYDDTPVHTNNFKKLVGEGFYDGILFHRVIEGFMIQTGDPDSKNATPGQHLGAGGPGYTLPAEIIPAHFHKAGAIAAARTGDQTNPMRRSSGSQFYIVHGKTTPKEQLQAYARYGFEFSEEQLEAYATVGGAPTLDAQYTVFGEVVEGMDVVDKIATVDKDAADRPKTDVKIIKATVLN